MQSVPARNAMFPSAVLLLRMPDADLNLLTALDALLADDSVAVAARKLGLSESAMSRTLSRLRAATGDPLLVRAGRRLVPTPHAAALRDRVRELAREAQAVLQPAAKGLDLDALERTFTIRANDGFVEVCAARLIAAVSGVAPGVRLRFAPKPDKDVQPLRDGMVDLDIGVTGEAAPEIRVQALFQDRFVGVVRQGHPLLVEPKVTPERYVAHGHVVASRRGYASGPVDEALASLGLARTVVAVVPSFPAALAIASTSDLIALVALSFFEAEHRRWSDGPGTGLQSFPLPVHTDPITISQMWHPRMEADPAHCWLRGLLRMVCREH